MNLEDRLEKETWDYHLKEVEEEIRIDDMIWEEHLKDVEEELKSEEEADILQATIYT